MTSSSAAWSPAAWSPVRSGVPARSGPAARQRLVCEPAVLHPPARPRARTFRRRRAVAAGLLLALVLAARVALGALGGGPLAAPERPMPAGATYVVQPGDTFWSIAQRLQPEGDPRPLVDRLVAAHRGPVLHVGERIALGTP